MIKSSLVQFNTILLISLAGCLSSLPVNAGEETPTLQELQQIFNERRPRSEGGRRGGLCALSPGTDILQKEFVIWSDRPLFIWQADPRELVVQRLRVLHSETDEIVWEHTLQANEQATFYSGKTLQPGQVYSWEITFRREPTKVQGSDVAEYRFQVMSSPQRSQIATELQALTTRLQASGATPEAIALQQANYFAHRGLLSDALQVLHTLPSPSVDMTQVLHNLAYSVCYPKPMAEGS